MNPEKLKKLQAQVRIGGKGTPRRKKVFHANTTATDDKKLENALRKVKAITIPETGEANMFMDDGTIRHFNNPKVQVSPSARTYCIKGPAQEKKITELLPEIACQLGPEDRDQLKKLASGAGTDEDDEVPVLVENFDEASKIEAGDEVAAVNEEKGKAKEGKSGGEKKNLMNLPQ